MGRYIKYLFLLIVTIATILSAQIKSIDVVKMTSSVVNIRVSNSTDSRAICQAKSGETFRYKETVGNWYKIIMYSGSYRYVHKSTAKISIASDRFSLTDWEVKGFIKELIRLEERAEYNSSNVEGENILIDCYKIKLFRKKLIPTHLYRTIIVYAAKNNLLF